MKSFHKKPELLAPAGNFEKMEIAFHYGADAVYLAGKDFSLRSFSENFSEQELTDAVQYAEDRSKKIYLACNVYSRNEEQERLETYLETIDRIGPHAVILSDPGILRIAQRTLSGIDIHLSTQANTTNVNAVRFWEDQGIKRVNLARELSLSEVAEIAGTVSAETEIFIHGAMCISYSGRCLLSSFLSMRDSNRGLCSHPCRWKYSLVEEQRPGEYHPLLEDDRGSYILNSKDLCMIDHIPEIIESGVDCVKIEGRMKGINYVASVVKTYREAIDSYCNNPSGYSPQREWIQELDSLFHRDYCTGFYFNRPDRGLVNHENRHGGKIHAFIGKVADTGKNNTCHVRIRNRLQKDDRIEILSPGKPNREACIEKLMDHDFNPVGTVNPNTDAVLVLDRFAGKSDIIRKLA